MFVLPSSGPPVSSSVSVPESSSAAFKKKQMEICFSTKWFHKIFLYSSGIKILNYVKLWWLGQPHCIKYNWELLLLLFAVTPIITMGIDKFWNGFSFSECCSFSKGVFIFKMQFFFKGFWVFFFSFFQKTQL